MSDERGSIATQMLLTLSVGIVATFMTIGVVAPAFAAEQTQEVVDELQQTTRFLAVAATRNLTATKISQGYLPELALSTGGRLLERPVAGMGWSDAAGAVGAADVTSVQLGGVELVEPGQSVPGTGGAVAKEQGVVLTATLNVSIWGGLVHEQKTVTLWAFPGNVP